MSSHPSSEGNEAFTACGGRIKDPVQYPSAVYHGERVYFCTRACLRVFEDAPEPFMSGETDHPSE